MWDIITNESVAPVYHAGWLQITVLSIAAIVLWTYLITDIVRWMADGERETGQSPTETRNWPK